MTWNRNTMRLTVKELSLFIVHFVNVKKSEPAVQLRSMWGKNQTKVLYDCLSKWVTKNQTQSTHKSVQNQSVTLNKSCENSACWPNPDPAQCQDLATILHKIHKSLCWLTSQYPVVQRAKIPACVFKFSALCTPCQCHSLQGGGRDDRNLYCKPFLCWNRRGGTLASW